ncbi:MAG: 3-phosphoshikimate 1-carboxyvinyltransferase, partial [Blastocatellia bacterium]|nr:3-phosphoshikimate 1-carboxyvinyltransferase [Blastocatellia bacterium]
RGLGVAIGRDGNTLTINGVGVNGLSAPEAPLDCGNSGTTMRLLAGVLAGQDFTSTLTGDLSLSRRPMQRIIEPLQMMGATILSNDGCPPLVIHGHRGLKALSYELLVASAQVKSCVLLAGLQATGRTEVIENEPTRDHTERMLGSFGVEVETGGAEREGESARRVAINGPANLKSRDLLVPGDVSSAAYFVAAAALLPASSLEVKDVGVNRTRVQFMKQLGAMGFDIEVAEVREENHEPIGTIRTRELSVSPKRSDMPNLIRGLVVPQLIDELPLLAVVGSQVDGGLEIRDAAELRVKESDRIMTTVQNLRAMGAEVEEFDDGLRVAGPTRLRGAKIEPRGDHRIAMAFTVAALLAEGETEINESECVAVSFPEFFDLIESVIER